MTLGDLSKIEKKNVATSGDLRRFDAFGSGVYIWLSALSFHTSVLDRTEASLASWGPEFERFNITEPDRLPLATKQQYQPTAHPPGFTPKTHC